MKLLPPVLLLLASQVHADEALSPFRHCRAILADAERLACFDALLPPAPLLLPSELSAAPASPPAATTLAANELPQLEAAPVAAAADTPPPAPRFSASGLARQWDLDEDNKLGTFVLRAHQPTYILPLWQLFSPNSQPSSPTQEPVRLFGTKLSNVETKYQLSFKSKLWQNVLGTPADLWFGYTQQSHWQMYNKGQSSPFRETDYEPEVMLTAPLPAHWTWQGWRLRMAGVGVVHQSNGQSDPLSRSWNRVYVMAGAEKGNLSLTGRWWYRLPESRADDDNPDITRYMGRGDVQAVYRWNDHTLGGRVRYNPLHGKGALQLDWTFPVAGRLRGYVQGFSGYGESLLDYNHHSRGLGIGLMLTDWLAN